MANRQSFKHESFHTATAISMNTAQEFWGYPRAKEHVFEEGEREKPNNPALRGAAVKFSATALPLIPGLPAMFYKNAGWPNVKLTAGIEGADPRYDPTVIPIRPGVHEDDSPSYVRPEQLRAPLKDAKRVFYSVLDYHEAYKSSQTTPSAVIEALLPVIRRDVDAPTHFSKAWLDLNIDLLKAAAAESTERWAHGKSLGVLDGVPVGIKDEADLKGYYKKSLGSLLNFTNPLDTTSWCVSKWEEKGAIIMGKLSMHGMYASLSG